MRTVITACEGKADHGGLKARDISVDNAALKGPIFTVLTPLLRPDRHL